MNNPVEMYCPYCNIKMEYGEVTNGGEKVRYYYCKNCNNYFIIRLNFFWRFVVRGIIGIITVLPLLLLQILLDLNVIILIILLLLIAFPVSFNVEKKIGTGKFLKWPYLMELTQREIEKLKLENKVNRKKI